MKNDFLKKTVISSLFAAICFVVTRLIYIPIAGASGYVNMGDVVVVFISYIIGGVWGGFASAIGSSLTDLSLGYVIYVPVTFCVKFLMAYLSGLILKKPNVGKLRILTACICSELTMVLGYFIFDGFIYGKAAYVSAFSNALQAAVCAVAAFFVITYTAKKFDYLRLNK